MSCLLIFRAYPEYGSCELLQIPSKYDFKPYAYGFQKNSPYLPLFNYYLKEMREKGTLEKIMLDYEVADQVCPDLSGLPIGFDSCFTAFLVLLVGMAVGLILLCLECFSRFIFTFSNVTTEETKKQIPKVVSENSAEGAAAAAASSNETTVKQSTA